MKKSPAPPPPPTPRNSFLRHLAHLIARDMGFIATVEVPKDFQKKKKESNRAP